MADGMSFNDYINNPAGKGSAVVTNRSMYKEMYQQKFDALLIREQGKIVYKVYHKNDSTDSYYIHMKIPSEILSNFYYDVVVRLYTTIGSKKSSTNLRAYAVQFYSNDSTFVYTYAYAFSKNKLFIKDLEPKMSKLALRERAKVRNPNNSIGYVKSLYFAYLTMEKYNLFERSVLDAEAKSFSKYNLLQGVEHSDKKMEDRQNGKKDTKVAKEKEKQKQPEKPRNTDVSSPTSKKSAVTKNVKTSKTTKRVASTKTSKVTSMSRKK